MAKRYYCHEPRHRWDLRIGGKCSMCGRGLNEEVAWMMNHPWRMRIERFMDRALIYSHGWR